MKETNNFGKMLEDIRHVGRVIDGKLVCDPDCPAITHRSTASSPPDTTKEAMRQPAPVTKEQQAMVMPETTDENWLKDFDEMYVREDDGLLAIEKHDAEGLKAFIQTLISQERHKLVEIAEELKRENKRTEKWSDDYFHALTDLISRIKSLN